MLNPNSPHYKRELNASYTVSQRLLPRHYEIQDCVLQGLNGKQIAAKLSMAYRQVMNILATPQFQHELSLRRVKTEAQIDESILRSHDAVTEVIKTQTLAAVNKLTDLMTNSPNDSVARQAANDILDRGGYPKVTKTQDLSTAQILIDDKTAIILEQTLKEIGTSPDKPTEQSSDKPIAVKLDSNPEPQSTDKATTIPSCGPEKPEEGNT